MEMIYLDHAAATPVSSKALQAMMPYFQEDFYNPSAPYLPAKHIREAYEEAKSTLAHVIGAKGVDLIITSGATESINLAFTAVQSHNANYHKVGKILILATEHAAVIEAAKSYPHTTVTVNQQGLINLEDLRAKLDDDVMLVSISLANNELGTIQPLAEIAGILRAVRSERLQRGVKTPLYLHSDASQALGLIDINVSRLGVDLLTLNAAKCGGPKGIGALYVGHGIRLCPISRGGGQERGLRSGTENIPSMMGFAIAAKESHDHIAYHRKQYQEMAQILRRELAHISIVAQNDKKVKHKVIPDPIFLGNTQHQLANFVPVSFPGIDAERLIYKLEAEGILVSTGAACAANKGTQSHVLTAIGLSVPEIAGSLRISLGSTNTFDQIKKTARIIAEAVRHEYSRARLFGVCQERLKEPPAGGEERVPCEDRHANGSLKTNGKKPTCNGMENIHA